jgi:hypothetical protein
MLDEDLQRLVREQGETPCELIDPATNRSYFLIPCELYERLKPLFEGDPITRQEQSQLLRLAGKRAGWDDPAMDAYDRYDEARAKSP